MPADLTQLEQLSLSGTRITDDGLSSGKLNSLTLLWKLNLSRTTISDRGIKHLKLPELSSINLDSTMISEKCWDLLIGECLENQFCKKLIENYTVNCTQIMLKKQSHFDSVFFRLPKTPMYQEGKFLTLNCEG